MDSLDGAVATIAAAIGEPARARILYSLMDGHARTSTELSAVAEVGPSTASAHLGKLEAARLVAVLAQGRHRYYRLANGEVGRALEGLAVLAGGPGRAFEPSTPAGLRAARTCYDHAAGALGVAIHDGLVTRGWLVTPTPDAYALTDVGQDALASLGVDLAAARARRRRFACPCLDWSERRPHLGGALGASLLAACLKKRWLERELDSRALAITDAGRRGLASRLGARL